jgi:excisionase family DNA binding protein
MEKKLPETCTAAAAAEMFKMSPRMVRELIKRGVIRGAHIGGKYVIEQKEVLKYFESKIVLPKGR